MVESGRSLKRNPTRVEIFTDGSCIGNPGPGGWCAILRSGSTEKVLSGSEPSTTNNRMELTAPLRALQALRRPCRARVVSDSKYLVQGMTEWVIGWRMRGWRTAEKKPVKNRDLWEALVEAASLHETEWVWIRGHAGHPENERADRLARDAIGRMGASRRD